MSEMAAVSSTRPVVAPLRLANGPGSWAVDVAGDPRNPPWRDVLRAVASTGYGWTELGPYGYLPEDPGVLRDALAEHRLGAVGSFLMEPLDGAPDVLGAHARRTARWSAQAGASVLVVLDAGDERRRLGAGRSADAPRASARAWGQLVEGARRVAAEVRDAGLVPVFHPHAGTRVEFADEVDRLLADVPELMLCLDTGHAAYAGDDPLDLFARHADRVAYLHLKDIDDEVHAYALGDRIDFAAAVARGVFVPLGTGAIDFMALRDELRAHGFDGLALVEQDVAPGELERAPRDARASRRYAERIGLARTAAADAASATPTSPDRSQGGPHGA